MEEPDWVKGFVDYSKLPLLGMRLYISYSIQIKYTLKNHIIGERSFWLLLTGRTVSFILQEIVFPPPFHIYVCVCVYIYI